MEYATGFASAVGSALAHNKRQLFEYRHGPPIRWHARPVNIGSVLTAELEILSPLRWCLRSTMPSIEDLMNVLSYWAWAWAWASFATARRKPPWAMATSTSREAPFNNELCWRSCSYSFLATLYSRE